MRKLLQLVFILFVCGYSFAQDAEFSQFYSNPVYLNPALAGSAESCRMNLNMRVKYPGFNAFKTYSVAYDQALYRGWSDTPFGGFGANVMLLNADGIINNYTLNTTYAHHFRIARKFYLNMGLSAGIVIKSINPTGIILPDGTEGGGSEGIYKETFTIPDFTFGIYGTYDDKYYGGASFSHFQSLMFKSSDEKVPGPERHEIIPYKISVHGGVAIPFGYENVLSPNFVYLHQGSFNQINVGLYTILGRITLGLWYKGNLRMPLPDAINANTHAISGLIGLNFEKIKVGYSYDSCISGLGTEAKGGHEISLSWTFDVYSTGKKRVIGAIKTPVF